MLRLGESLDPGVDEQDDHLAIPGAEPDSLTPKDDKAFERSLMLRQARNRALAVESWVADEFEFIEKEIVTINEKLRARKQGKGQPVVFFMSAAEVLKAKDSGVIDKAEARKILGLGRKRQPRQLRRKT